MTGNDVRELIINTNLQHDIQKLLQEYSQKYSVIITDIYINRTFEVGKSIPIKYDVYTAIKKPDKHSPSSGEDIFYTAEDLEKIQTLHHTTTTIHHLQFPKSTSPSIT